MYSTIGEPVDQPADTFVRPYTTGDKVNSALNNDNVSPQPKEYIS